MGGGGDALQRLGPLENLSLGCMAGVATKLLNYPLLTAKNYSQQGLPIPYKPNVVYRGLPIACLNLGGTTAVQFLFTGVFQKMLADGDGTLSRSGVLGAAFLGGIVSGIPGSVWELTMIQQQRFGKSLVETPRGLVSQYGWSSLARGMTTCMGRESLYTLAMLGACPEIQKALVIKYELAPDVALIPSAFLSSLISATLSHPLDTIKTCMQGDVGQAKYTDVSGTARSLINEYGVAQGLFKGLAWRVTLITTTFFLVNKMKQVICPVAFPHLYQAEAKEE